MRGMDRMTWISLGVCLLVYLGFCMPLISVGIDDIPLVEFAGMRKGRVGSNPLSAPRTFHNLFLISGGVEVGTRPPIGSQIPQQPALSGGALFHDICRVPVEIERPKTQLAVSVYQGFSGTS